ncbi:helix-turn-helix domain-containing protein [Tissierella praeacuta]|uniref:helix-turn-helix domain-containing protein n=1 Tax=Tissierella praeacuta TaxID=43131 RepID=UPI002FDA7896
MGRKSRFTADEKLKYINICIRGEDSITHTAKLIGVSKSTLERWIRNYESLGIVCKKYRIRSHRQLRDWILKYNSHEELKSSGMGGIPIMTKGRKTTYEERVDIVKYCIEHQKNYAETARHFQVSYQQAYSWVTKYEKDGVESLQDKRGRKKSLEEMSELEKLKAENKLLQAENKRKQMEIDLLKKLEEVERGRY